MIYFQVLPADLQADQSVILKAAPRLLQALVDVISSNGCALFSYYRDFDWYIMFILSLGMNPAVAAMELSQMIIQAMWDSDSPLKQLPHVSQEIIDRYIHKFIQSPIYAHVRVVLHARSPNVSRFSTCSTLKTIAAMSSSSSVSQRSFIRVFSSFG